MDSTKAPPTHVWSDAEILRQIEQDGRALLHQRCLRCESDFAEGLDGSGWHAFYVRVLRVELLADSVDEQWLREECPGRLLPDDDVSRATWRC
jgi:hypothetical protein